MATAELPTTDLDSETVSDQSVPGSRREVADFEETEQHNFQVTDGLDLAPKTTINLHCEHPFANDIFEDDQLPAPGDPLQILDPAATDRPSGSPAECSASRDTPPADSASHRRSQHLRTRSCPVDVTSPVPAGNFTKSTPGLLPLPSLRTLSGDHFSNLTQRRGKVLERDLRDLRWDIIGDEQWIQHNTPRRKVLNTHAPFFAEYNIPKTDADSRRRTLWRDSLDDDGCWDSLQDEYFDTDDDEELDSSNTSCSCAKRKHRSQDARRAELKRLTERKRRVEEQANRLQECVHQFQRHLDDCTKAVAAESSSDGSGSLLPPTSFACPVCRTARPKAVSKAAFAKGVTKSWRFFSLKGARKRVEGAIELGEDVGRFVKAGVTRTIRRRG